MNIINKITANRVVLMCALSMLSSLPSLADSVSYTQDFGSATTPFTATYPNANDFAFQLPSFNESEGTLESVTFSLSLNTSMTPSLFAVSSDASGVVVTGSSVNLTSVGGLFPLVTASFESPPQTLMGGAAGTVTSGTTVLGTADNDVELTTGLSAFESPTSGNLDFVISDSGAKTTGIPLSGIAAFLGSSSYYGSADITYNFDTVTQISEAPEPSTWILLPGGIGALLLCLRRRAAANQGTL